MTSLLTSRCSFVSSTRKGFKGKFLKVYEFSEIVGAATYYNQKTVKLHKKWINFVKSEVFLSNF